MSRAGDAGDDEEGTTDEEADDTVGDEEADTVGDDGTGDEGGDGANAAAVAFEADLEEYPLFEFLGVRVETVEPGRVVLAVPFSDHLVNISDRDVHGGVTATVVDTASGMALRSTFEEPESATLTTTDLNVRYVRPARDDLRVEAEVVRAGATMGVTEAEVTTVHEGDRKVVATGGTTYRLFRGEDA